PVRAASRASRPVCGRTDGLGAVATTDMALSSWAKTHASPAYLIISQRPDHRRIHGWLDVGRTPRDIGAALWARMS
ncbi:MAG TPA: hypothetical protein VE665_06560, partial [Hyphomicrobiaceae bacterium]|nr:hypothetical protein [Hyphomicrobiaceae bacterium]